MVFAARPIRVGVHAEIRGWHESCCPAPKIQTQRCLDNCCHKSTTTLAPAIVERDNKRS